MDTLPPIGLGLIGAGAMARAYAECLARYTRGAALLAVAGGTRAGELAAAFGVAAEPSVEALLARPGIAGVIVATPETLHREQVLAAAKAGRHVLVEKPMAPTVAECDAMIAACAAARVKLMVVKHWRFRGVHVRARERLRAGGLGRIQRIRNHTLSPRASSLATVAKKPFYLDPAGGGLLMGWAVHNLDWVRCLAASAPVTVTATLAPAAAPLQDGALDVRIEFENGVAAEVRVAIDLPEDPGPEQVFRTVVNAERGELDLDGYGHLRVHDASGDRIDWTQPAFNPRDPSDPLRLEAFAAMLQGFIDSIRHDQPPAVTGRDGRAAVALFEAARTSAALGRTVKLDPVA